MADNQKKQRVFTIQESELINLVKGLQRDGYYGDIWDFEEDPKALDKIIKKYGIV